MALLLTGSMLTTSCTDYQDEIDALDYRVTVLEEMVKTINNNLDAMRVIVDAMAAGDYITGVRETEGGYVINFFKNGPLYVMDGVDGQNGRDAQAPDITIAQDPDDGEWYWMLNGQWLMADGQRVRASGKDGRDGQDGRDGRDGKSASMAGASVPRTRINPDNRHWEISTDGGITWTDTGCSADGQDGRNGIDGKNGADGTDDIFMDVQVTDGGNSVTFILRDGRTFTVPIM